LIDINKHTNIKIYIRRVIISISEDEFVRTDGVGSPDLIVVDVHAYLVSVPHDLRNAAVLAQLPLLLEVLLQLLHLVVWVLEHLFGLVVARTLLLEPQVVQLRVRVFEQVFGAAVVTHLVR